MLLAEKLILVNILKEISRLIYYAHKKDDHNVEAAFAAITHYVDRFFTQAR